MCRTSGRSGSISCHTCTSLFAHLYLFCKSLLRISFDACVVPWGGVGASPVPHVHLISHMYVSFAGLFYRFLSTHVSYLGAECQRLFAHMNVSCHTCTSLFALACLYCKSLFWVSFDICVVPRGGLGESSETHVRLFPHTYVSFHTRTSLFTRVCLLCRFLSHKYVSFVGLFPRM